jgi:hypothetical protein
VCPSFLSYISLLFKQCYTLDSLPWFLIPKSPFRFKKKHWMIHAMYNEAYLPKSPK